MEWGYSGNYGPENWHEIYSAAAGHRQSPIDIQPEKFKVAACVSKQKFQVQYHSRDMSVIRNTGHSWQVCTQNNGVSGMLEVTGGPLVCDYELAQIHAHWGGDDSMGSEHTIDGKHFSGELHLVHWNKTNYKTIEEATNHPDGLCVLAVLLQVGDNPHSEIQKIVDKIPDIVHKSDVTTLDEPVNPKMLLPKKLGYWTYMGSLTTPPCLECVVWIVFNDPVEISHDQLEAFRCLRCHSKDGCEIDSCEDKMRSNFRPTFPLGDRIILRSGGVTKS